MESLFKRKSSYIETLKNGDVGIIRQELEKKHVDFMENMDKCEIMINVSSNKKS